MGIFNKLFSNSKPAPANSRSHYGGSSQESRASAASPQSLRKELLRSALRDTLNTNSIPLNWINIEALAATSSGRDAGIHARLLIKHWDTRLMTHGLALQEELKARLELLDPNALQWLAGISWQYSLPPHTEIAPLPAPESWQQLPVIQPPSNSMRADLDRMLAEGNAHYDNTQPNSFAATEPSPLGRQR